MTPAFYPHAGLSDAGQMDSARDLLICMRPGIEKNFHGDTPGQSCLQAKGNTTKLGVHG